MTQTALTPIFALSQLVARLPAEFQTPREVDNRPEFSDVRAIFGRPANNVDVLIDIGDHGIADVVWVEYVQTRPERDGRFRLADDAVIPEKFLHALERAFHRAE